MEDLFSLNSKLKLEEYEFSSDDFELASESSKENFMTKTPPTSYLQDALRRLKENKVAMVSIGFLIIVCIFAFIGPFLVKGDYTTQYRGDENLFPCLRYPFGTDKLGRDLMVRTMYGTRVSLIVGIFASFIVLIIGTIYGAISGYFGGRVDAIMMRILDLIYSIPDVLVVILLSIGISQPMKSFVNSSSSEFAKKIGVLGPALISIFIAFGLLYWVGMARIIRGQVLMLKKQEFVTAVEALGGSKKRIIRRHLFPNCIGQVIVMTAMQIPSAIFLESFLSFLGIGVSAPMTSLGALAADALGGIYSYAYRLIIPSLLLSLMILSLNLFADGLRDALDPRLKK
ncbi:MAG: ABC transporter permease [Anaerococcus vaginalis]|uniref:ABC transporter, permease protein n=2 Tax=Anaerococcus vaginalis TaxID=33037 RepID=C7HRZ7_9FIRM|nr:MULTISPECIES: ABC transporter permease [Anaerococcus]EEU13501.1 ABC transporter, permease protein [Anaerococcus vaginalis ATCC 51170]MDD7767115.1 ABC transporter permease [Anaerococcus vaginalis]MDU0945297.1 ABC transporter permease [Anaerococcus vaginalis]MDU4448075.1 ABC transporter permease [Anaerococcus vaginalis]MDU5342658.1 ABC transporter permease [Anaerococcus vaginalis]